MRLFESFERPAVKELTKMLGDLEAGFEARIDALQARADKNTRRMKETVAELERIKRELGAKGK
jgi:hypothetical protein